MVKVLQRCKRVSVPDHQSNFPFLVMRHRWRQIIVSSALILRLPASSAAQAIFTYIKSSHHEYLYAMRQQKMYKVHMRILGTEFK